ncbi:DUF3422 family protein [Rugamonas sp. CCM 8940]|uniref:DUF3422 family protein n=1 Tax=Rugamonas sp. CCM 8940 TaxID=2765359 RepID=UPI0018F4BCE6|nr:DUF3422 domain-containing protein [Rugamonas sp. CCM 8940]MBJ7311867.1 DUF3422 domain-containing protein [Rugamonas sp. CCM 8940]
MPVAYRANADFAKLNHPLRVPLAAEIHSRPFLALQAPETLTHFALYAPVEPGAQHNHRAVQHRILQDLCIHYGVAVPHPQARYFYHDFDRFRLKWECHTEFATYTFVERGAEAAGWRQAFERAPLQHVPQEWLAGLHGKIIVAAHVVLSKDAPAPAPADATGQPHHTGGPPGGTPGGDPRDDLRRELRELFQGNVLVGGSVGGGGGEIWTDFKIQPDGFSRFVVRDLSLREFQAGRLVGRLLEIETYRTMALLGLPQAEASQPALNGIESELAALTATLVQSEHGAAQPMAEANEDQNLLHRISGLAARLEKLSVSNSYRFAASQAYFSLVQARIQELRELRIEGMPTLAEFMGRRLAPAMHTCTSVAQRQEALATRIARSNDLLRTRVGIEQERQNRKILQSLDARAAQQLRLQQAVEGLSVVAISYYLLGLVGYAGKAMKASNLPVNPDLMTGLMVPLVTAGVWYCLRRLHQQLHATAGATARPGG